MTGDQRAACAGASEPLWDAYVEGEDAFERTVRHRRALAICNRCPARQVCRDETNPKVDDGVRGGRVLPTIPDRERRSPYPHVGESSCWTGAVRVPMLSSRATGPTAKQFRPPAAPATSRTRSR